MATKTEIREALEILEELEATNKGSDKQEILRQGADNEVLRTLIMMVVGQDRFHIRPSEDIPAQSTQKQKATAVYARFLKITDQLKTREVTGNKATERVETFLASLFPVPKKWYTRVINKNLRIGVSEKTVRKVWGDEAMNLSGDDEIIFFKDKCPLAEKWDDLVKKKSWTGVEYGEDGWLSEPKLDGDRALIFVFPQEERVVVLTRGGKRWTHLEECDAFVENMLETHHKVAPYTGFGDTKPTMYDGEFISRSGSWNETSSIVRSHVNFDEERFLSQIRVLLWDWCPIVYFNSGEFRLPLSERKYTLMKAAGAKKSFTKFKLLANQCYIVGHRVVYNDEEMWKDNRRRLKAGFEGSMLKNPNAFMLMERTADVIKIKPEDSATGVIVGFKPGKGKHAAAKDSYTKKARREMKQWGDVEDDGYFLHCKCGKKNVKKLIKTLQQTVNDSNDRRISCHANASTVSYRYSPRLGYFVVKTEEGERIRVGGKMKFDQLMDYWMRRRELKGTKIDYKYQGGSEEVAKARFNKFDRLRPDL
jgi:DNA ligase-1